MSVSRKLLSLFVLLLTAALLAACGTGGSGSSEREHRTPWDHDRGDQRGVLTCVFWPEQCEDDEDAEEERRPLLDRLLGRGGDDDAASEREEAMERRIQELERSLQQQALAAEGTERGVHRPAERPEGELLPHVGVIIQSPDGELETRLGNTLAGVARDYPLLFSGSELVRTQIADYGCTEGDITDCLAGLSRYPGLRMLALIEVEPRGDDRVRMRTTTFDVGLDAEYGSNSVELPALEGQVARPALEAYADRVLLGLLDRMGNAPWFTHSFAEEDGVYFLGAGEAAGLSEGMELKVRDGGRVIRSPSGRPVAWVPGAVKGVLEVEALVGENLAQARLVSGDGPSEDDPVMPAR